MTNITNINQAKERRIDRAIATFIKARKLLDLRNLRVEVERELNENPHTLTVQGPSFPANYRDGTLTFASNFFPNGNPDDMDGYKAEITREANRVDRENLTDIIDRLRLPLPPKV